MTLTIRTLSGLRIPQPPKPPPKAPAAVVSPRTDSGVDSDDTHSIKRTATLATDSVQTRAAGVKGRRPPSRAGAAAAAASATATAVAAAPTNTTTTTTAGGPSSLLFADDSEDEYPPAYAPLSISSPPFAGE